MIAKDQMPGAALRMIDWIEPLLRRESYLALLWERPGVHERLLRLLGWAGLVLFGLLGVAAPAGAEGGAALDASLLEDVRTMALGKAGESGGSRVEVSCHHHQSVASHPGYAAVARADDGTVEAMESTGDLWRLAVQWHPETRVEIGLMAGLVDAARRHATR